MSAKQLHKLMKKAQSLGFTFDQVEVSGHFSSDSEFHCADVEGSGTDSLHPLTASLLKKMCADCYSGMMDNHDDLIEEIEDDLKDTFDYLKEARKRTDAKVKNFDTFEVFAEALRYVKMGILPEYTTGDFFNFFKAMNDEMYRMVDEWRPFLEAPATRDQIKESALTSVVLPKLPILSFHDEGNAAYQNAVKDIHKALVDSSVWGVSLDGVIDGYSLAVKALYSPGPLQSRLIHAPLYLMLPFYHKSRHSIVPVKEGQMSAEVLETLDSLHAQEPARPLAHYLPLAQAV